MFLNLNNTSTKKKLSFLDLGSCQHHKKAIKLLLCYATDNTVVIQ